MKKLMPFLLGAAIPLLLAAALLLTGVLQFSSSSRIEGRGYASPEDAVMAFGKALQRQDLDGMLATFAMESYLEHRDLGQEIQYRGFDTTPNQFPWSRLPDNTELAAELALESRRAAITRGIHAQYLYLLLEGTPYSWENLPGGQPPTLYFKSSEEAEAHELLATLQAQQPLRQIQIGAVRPIGELIDLSGEGYDKYYNRNLAAYGAEDLREFAMELSLDGTDYLLILQTVRYDGRWYNMDFSGYLGGYLGGFYTAASGLIPVSALED